MLSQEDLTKLFLETVRDNLDFKDAIKIVKDNSKRGCWLIGGFVYRSISSVLYGTSKPSVDFDFIVEDLSSSIMLPNLWIQLSNKYSNPKFKRKDGLEIDIVPLQNIHSVIRRNLEPNIKNFLTGTPLTIQSILYDVKNSQVIGDVGIKAILSKTVAINNAKQAMIYAKKKNKLLNEIIKEKAVQLGFDPVFNK